MRRIVQRNTRAKDEGYVLLGVMVLMTVAAIITASALNSAASTSRSVQAAQQREREYFTAEDSFSKAVQWLNSQSTNMVTPIFARSTFYNSFCRSAPSYGANDTSIYKVPTRIKIRGTSNSAILHNFSGFGTAAFPATTNASTNAAFAPVTQFSGANVGSDSVRITLVDALPFNPVSETTSPNDCSSPIPPVVPGTDYYPVYQIDSMRSLTRGGAVKGYMTGSMVINNGFGFFAKSYFEMRQGCDSYSSSSSTPTYLAANKRANCSVGTDANMMILQNNSVYGSATTKGSILTTSPWGGSVCANFSAGCPVPGTRCQGASCTTMNMPSFNTFSGYCPTTRPDPNPANNSTLTTTAIGGANNCWSTLTIGSNRTVTFTSTTTPYYIDTLNIANNATVLFNPSPSTGTITLFVNRFQNDRFNGNQVLNAATASGALNRPTQLRINYIGTNALLLNGTAAMNAFITAPKAAISVQGNFDYSGGIVADSLTFTGSGALHYDESGNIATISDMQYRPRLLDQYSR